MKNKVFKIIAIILIIALIITGIVFWYVKVKKPHDIAVENYNSVVVQVESKNTELDESIKALQTVIDTGEQPLDENALTTAHTVLSKAHDTMVIIGDIPKKIADIITRTEELSKPIDYTAIITELNEACTSLKNSIQQLKQVTNPTEEFVIQRLETVPDITGIQAVTEDNDPNGNLNKAGGYTATVYFGSIKVNQDMISGNSVIEKGTDGGGAVEVYANVEDATKRNDYLASFDGAGILSSGSHTVVGTTVIRTSDKLTATQQKELESAVINALTEIK